MKKNMLCLLIFLILASCKGGVPISSSEPPSEHMDITSEDFVIEGVYENDASSPYVYFQNKYYDMRTDEVVPTTLIDNKAVPSYLELPSYDENDYVFYVLTASLPVLYGSLIAFNTNAPNTYFWFERGNTFSVQYTMENFPNFTFLEGQTLDNRVSGYKYLAMRQTVRNIIRTNPNAKFHLYINDTTVSLILDIMVQAGVNFSDLNVIFLSDGTFTYGCYKDNLPEEVYSAQKSYFEAVLAEYENIENRAIDDFYINFVQPGTTLNENYKLEGTARGLDRLSFMLDANYPNVKHIMQFPELLTNEGEAVTSDREAMLQAINKRQPSEYFYNLEETVRNQVHLAFMAGAVAYTYNPDTGEHYFDNAANLETLEDAIAYFDEKLLTPTKQPVVITGTRDVDTSSTVPYGEQQLEFNESYMLQTIEYYNVKSKFVHENAIFDSKTSTITLYEGEEVVAILEAGYGSIDGVRPVEKAIESTNYKLKYRERELSPGENGAVFYFKPHPSCMPFSVFNDFLIEKGIEVLPRRTPAEIFLWLYPDVDYGGFTSSLYMSASADQTRFYYADDMSALANPTNILAELGYYPNAHYFQK